jgi:hypothetical protein
MMGGEDYDMSVTDILQNVIITKPSCHCIHLIHHIHFLVQVSNTTVDPKVTREQLDLRGLLVHKAPPGHRVLQATLAKEAALGPWVLKVQLVQQDHKEIGEI